MPYYLLYLQDGQVEVSLPVISERRIWRNQKSVGILNHRANTNSDSLEVTEKKAREGKEMISTELKEAVKPEDNVGKMNRRTQKNEVIWGNHEVSWQCSVPFGREMRIFLDEQRDGLVVSKWCHLTSRRKKDISNYY